VSSAATARCRRCVIELRRGCALFTFSFLTGFSIGLFILPLAAVALFWLAARSGGRETVGLVEGAG
jgi:hypothetical protein